MSTHGQEIYKEAYNSAWEQYKNPEDRDGEQGDMIENGRLTELIELVHRAHEYNQK